MEKKRREIYSKLINFLEKNEAVEDRVGLYNGLHGRSNFKIDVDRFILEKELSNWVLIGKIIFNTDIWDKNSGNLAKFLNDEISYFFIEDIRDSGDKSRFEIFKEHIREKELLNQKEWQKPEDIETWMDRANNKGFSIGQQEKLEELINYDNKGDRVKVAIMWDKLKKHKENNKQESVGVILGVLGRSKDWSSVNNKLFKLYKNFGENYCDTLNRLTDKEIKNLTRGNVSNNDAERELRDLAKKYR